MLCMIFKNLTDVVQGKSKLGKIRSSKWPSVRKKHLAQNPVCSVCGSRRKLEVHHIIPFHKDSSLELNPQNLVTLCESKSFGVVCHLLYGHLGDYKKINPNVVEDIVIWNKKLSRS